MYMIPVQRSYVVEISTEDMLALLKAETIIGGGPLSSEEDTLATKLQRLEGVNSVQYDGHFGANIFLTIEHEDDKPARHREALDVIRDHLILCRKEAAQ